MVIFSIPGHGYKKTSTDKNLAKKIGTASPRCASGCHVGKYRQIITTVFIRLHIVLAKYNNLLLIFHEQLRIF